MKLATNLLGKALATMGHLAGLVRPPHEHFKHLVHVRWFESGVVLSATDGHRAYLITLRAERPTGEPGESTIAISPEPWSAPLNLTTIFRGPHGEVKVIGEKESPVGISRTRTEHDFFALDLGQVNDRPWPVHIVEHSRIAMDRGFATDFQNRGHRIMHINTDYMMQALTTINYFWRELEAVEPPYVKMKIPAHPDVPISFTCRYPEKTAEPVFEIETIIMPFLYWDGKYE